MGKEEARMASEGRNGGERGKHDERQARQAGRKVLRKERQGKKKGGEGGKRCAEQRRTGWKGEMTGLAGGTISQRNGRNGGGGFGRG